MNSNEPHDAAILALASAMRHICPDSKTRALVDQVEAVIQGAKQIEQLSSQQDGIAAALERLQGAVAAQERMKKHMPASVSNFGADAAGNRMTWKVEPTTSNAGESAKQMTDEALMLNELRAIRAELKALREHSGARSTSITDTERFAHMPPPEGAKQGHWEAVLGSAIPVWVESVPMECDPVAGLVKRSAPVATEAAGLRI